MAGVSEMPYRRIALGMGAGAAPTELISAKGLMYGQKRSRDYLVHGPEERPFWVQLFGGDAESMAAGAECAASLGADIIDINMGCPVRKVTKNGAGAALLADPKRASAIVEAIQRRTGLPVTVKIRSGWDAHTVDPFTITRAVADTGAVAVALHARTRAQGYAGKADWSLIAKLVEASPIPVIGNGDVFSAEDGHRMMAETGCAAVMIGRGALGNPWIFAQLSRGEPPPTPVERWQLVQRHLAAHLDHVGDELRGLRRFRQHLLWYAHGLRGAAAFRRAATQIDNLAQLTEVGEAFFSTAEGAANGAKGPAEVGAALG